MLFVLIVLLIKLPAACEGCPNGWFGKSCNLSCSCLSSKTCTIDGDCPANDKCGVSKFGPGCQFRDISPFHGRPKSVLWDTADSTCNPDVNATSATITLQNIFPLSWFRMVVKGKGYQQLDFTTKLNNDLECPDEQRFVIDRATVDVMCSGRIDLKTLKIEGKIVGSMCSLKISGGRTVSLKERTWQSSNLSSNKTQIGPQNAVDSIIPTEHLRPPCTSTNLQRDRPEWRLYFNAPFYVHSLQVYNQMREPCRGEVGSCQLGVANLDVSNQCRHLSVAQGCFVSYPTFEIAQNPHTNTHRLVNFDVRLYTAGDNQTNNFSYNESIGQYLFLRRLTPQVPISYISIQQAYQPVPTDRILAICEVIILGDNICPKRTYGFNCLQCQCNTSQVCHQFTGACSKKCRENCLGGVCDLLTEHCFRCKPGYHGEYCDKECEVRFYGQDCKLQCPEMCFENKCDNETGYCYSCQANWTGPYCSECAVGFYGEGCNLQCPEMCFENKCDNVTGDCYSCQGNWTGPYCAECAVGCYGEDCNLPCPEMCFENKCDNVTGDCFSCQGNWIGPYCTGTVKSRLECAVGFYGEDCNLPCPEMCFENKCDNVTGDCFSCQENRAGLDCAECAVGFYGEGCNLQCPEMCFENKCDNVTGDCYSCQANRAGLDCAECMDGYYGGNCTKICSRFCRGKKCNQLSGNCLLCLGARIGHSCEGCPDKHFGIQCEQRCPKNCYNETCNSMTGRCSKCLDGYAREICKLLENKPGMWAAPLSIVPFILLLFFCMPQSKHDDSDDESKSSYF